MKRFFSLVILLVLLVVLCCACAPTYNWEPDFQIFWNDFVSKYGKVEIVNIGLYGGGTLEGNIEGYFTFYRGEINGSVSGRSETIIRFSWKSNEYPSNYYISDIPASKFKRINGNGTIMVDFGLVYPEKEYPLSMNDELPIENDAEKLSKMTPNDVISYFSNEVTISMTDKQYMEFIQALSNAG